MDEPQRRDPDLYEADFFQWTQEQAAALRRAGTQRVNAPLDWENLAEEIESLGKRDRREVRNRVKRIIEHLAKLAASPARDPRAGWMAEIESQRDELAQVLQDSPSLGRDLDAVVETVTDRAFEAARLALAQYGENDRQLVRWWRRGFTSDEVATSGWYPAEISHDMDHDTR